MWTDRVDEVALKTLSHEHGGWPAVSVAHRDVRRHAVVSTSSWRGQPRTGVRRSVWRERPGLPGATTCAASCPTLRGTHSRSLPSATGVYFWECPSESSAQMASHDVLPSALETDLAHPRTPGRGDPEKTSDCIASRRHASALSIILSINSGDFWIMEST